MLTYLNIQQKIFYLNIKFTKLHNPKTVRLNVDLLWKFSLKFNHPIPSWSGLMHLIRNNSDKTYEKERLSKINYMRNLQNFNSTVYEIFNGANVIRCTAHSWAGLPPDLVTACIYITQA